jgi:hypothetical protein
MLTLVHWEVTYADFGQLTLFHQQPYMERYDAEVDEWSVVCNMTVGRRGLGVCVLKGEGPQGGERVYAAGGQVYKGSGKQLVKAMLREDRYIKRVVKSW